MTVPHLKKNAIKDFQDIMQNLQIWKDSNYNITNKQYVFENKSTVDFISLDAWDKLLGSKSEILFINEANKSLTYEMWVQLLIRNTGIIFMDYNPFDSEHFLYDLDKREDTETIHSTYKDNPFLNEIQIKEIENMSDPDLARIMRDGLRGVSTQSLIFPNFEITEDGQKYKKNSKLIYGLDFGYNPDETALIAGWINKENNTLYIEELIYEQELTNQDLIEKIKCLNIDRYTEIVCDHEPQRIEEIYREGYYCQKAVKGAGSLISSILNLKKYNIVINKSAENTLKELKKYKWKVNPETGKRMSIPDDKNSKDHAIAAMRYLVGYYIEYYQ